MAFEKVEYSFPDEQEDIKKPEIESSSAIEIDLDKGKDKKEEVKAEPEPEVKPEPEAEKELEIEVVKRQNLQKMSLMKSLKTILKKFVNVFNTLVRVIMMKDVLKKRLLGRNRNLRH